MLGAPSDAALRREQACAGWRAIANAVNESPIDRFLTFRTKRSNDLVSRKMVHSAMVASIAGPIATRRPTAADPRTAIRGRARQLHGLCMILFRQRRPKTKNGVRGRRNPLTRLDSRKERAWIFLP